MSRQNLIKYRRGTAAQWAEANPTLKYGEPGFETDTLKFKLGDGDTPWNSLKYIGFNGGNIDPTSFSVATAVGTNVTLNVIEPSADKIGVQIVFPVVDSGGITNVNQVFEYSNLTLSSGYSVDNTIAAFEINTNIIFSGNALIIFIFPQSTTQILFDSIKIFKYSSGTTTDVTVLSGPNAPNYSTRTIYASVNSFSEFYLIPNYIDPCIYGSWESLGFTSYLDCSQNYNGSSSSSNYYPSLIKNNNSLNWSF